MKQKILLLLLIIILGFIISVYSIYKINESREIFKKIEHSSVLAQKIKYFDEVLTMSARMATLNGDIKWIKRYNKNIAPLDNAIKKSLELVPDAQSHLIKVDTTNKKLIQLEEKAINFSKQQKYKKAQSLLFSIEYETLKRNYTAGLNKFISTIQKSNSKQEKLINKHLNVLKIIVLLSLSTIILSIIALFSILIKAISNEKKLKEKTDELNILNKNLEIKVKEEVKKSKEKDSTILEQSKNAALGEMIGNIAHQWRQPLSVISTGATGLKLQKEFSTLTDEELLKTCDTINNNAQYLSKTIDDFKNFIKGDRKKVKFFLSETVDSFLNLVKGTLKNNQVKLVLDLNEDIEINGYENELMQSLINIINNAKDALKINSIEEKYIFITTTQNKNNAIIEIKDNAKGIPNDVLPRIFEPYFTTKHQFMGTGLGLHMTYNLITNGMKGTIQAKNTTYLYQNKEYTGAIFTITIPLS